MTEHASQPVGNKSTDGAPPGPRLTGRWLRAARAAWVVLALLALLVLLSSLPGYVQEFGGHLGDTYPDEGGAGVVRLLSGLASLAAVLLSLALAAIFYRQRFGEPVATVLSFYLIGYAVVMAGPLEAWSSYWQDSASLAQTLQAVLVAVPSVALFALFPSGRFVPGWTRWLLVLTIPWCLSLLFLPSLDEAALVEGSPLALALLGASLIGLFAAGLYAQVYRFRHVSSAAERQQTKWVVYGFSLWLAYILLSSIPYFYLGSLPPDAPQPWWAALSGLGWFLALNIIPVSLTVAVTRYHLWDIDLVINRTLVYAALTLCVVSIYALVVGGVGALFGSSGNWVIALVATGLVAVLFQPLRERLQRGINRLLYGQRDEPYEVLARLGRRMEDTLSPELVLPTMVETIAQTLQLPYVAIVTGHGSRSRIAESYGKPSSPPWSYPLSYQGDAIGQLLVAPRTPEEAFTVSEERLLQDIARQSGAAVHNVQLTEDLQRARRQIVTSREEERRRLRRDLHDGLGPSLAAQMLMVGSARAALAEQPEMADTLLAKIETDIESTLADLRRIVYDLRPPALDQLGLAGAIRAYAVACESGEVGDTQRKLTVRVEMPDELPSLTAAVEVAAYHIAREAMANVVHYAGAATCTVRLSHENGERVRLVVSVRDDGVGLAEGAPAGVGLASMRERAAELGGICTIESNPDTGTHVKAVLPWEPELE